MEVAMLYIQLYLRNNKSTTDYERAFKQHVCTAITAFEFVHTS